MVNHARTLLCNVDGTSRPPLGEFGEEYINPNYRKVTVPQSVLTLHRLIFGSDPDPVFMNYRASQLMKFSHARKVKSYVIDLDPRITYDLDDTEFLDTAFGSTISEFSGFAGLTPSVLGVYSADNAKGRAYDQWDVRISSGTIERQHIRTGKTAASVWESTDELSPRYSLPLSEIEVRFVDTESLSPSGCWWRITSVAKPGSLVDVKASLAVAGQETFSTLFSESEPYLSFKNMWDSDMFHLQMAGLTLAMIFRTEEARNA